jgi:hypothetical protein
VSRYDVIDFLVVQPLLVHLVGQTLGIVPIAKLLPNYFDIGYLTNNSANSRGLGWIEGFQGALMTALIAKEFLSRSTVFINLKHKLGKLVFPARYQINNKVSDDEYEEEHEVDIHRQSGTAFQAAFSNFMSFFSLPIVPAIQSSEISRQNLQSPATGLGHILRIGQRILSFTIVILPMKAFFMGHAVSRAQIPGLGIPGMLGLRGWGEVTRWYFGVGLLQGFHVVLTETARMIPDYS